LQRLSRQHEWEFGRYYAYPNYWGSTGLWGEGYYFGAGRSPWTMSKGTGDVAPGSEFVAVQDARQRMAHVAAKHSDGDTHLRSCTAVIGNYTHAADGDIGHVQGMLVDENSWAIRYLVINTSNWWLGHQVLVAPEWITDVSWSERKVKVDLTRQAIKESPPWDPVLLPDRSQEAVVHQHYGRKGYWDSEKMAPIARPINTDRASDHH